MPPPDAAITASFLYVTTEALTQNLYAAFT
jgi:hypothetical protein